MLMSRTAKLNLPSRGFGQAGPEMLDALWVPCSHTSLDDRSDELLKSFTIGGHAE
jgi:hypothetical protein